MKALKGLHKIFWVIARKCEIKIKLIILQQLSNMHENEKVKNYQQKRFS